MLKMLKINVEFNKSDANHADQSQAEEAATLNDWLEYRKQDLAFQSQHRQIF